MSGEKDLVAADSIVTLNPSDTNHFRGEKISIQKVPFYDKEQFKRVLESLEAAGMTFAEAAKAGVHLGYPVTIETQDAPIRPGNWENQQHGIREDEHKIIAWQRRGEKASLNRQLASPVGDIDNKIALVSNDLAIFQQEPSEQVIEIIEGIEVSTVEQGSLVEPEYGVQAETEKVAQPGLNQDSLDQARFVSPFLKPPPLKNAA